MYASASRDPRKTQIGHRARRAGLEVLRARRMRATP